MLAASVEAGSPAANAGVKSRDIILSLDGIPITGGDDLIRALAGDKIGRTVEIEILRGGSRQLLPLVPEERSKRG